MKGLISLVGAAGILLVYSGLTSSAARRPTTWIRQLDELAAEAGWQRLSGRGVIGLSVGCSAAAALLAVGLTGSLALAMAGACAGAMGPTVRARARRDDRRAALRQVWPDALASIVSGIRAGMALPECCVALAETGPGELRSAFASFASTYRSTGSFEAALRCLQQQLADPVADRVVAVLSMAHQVGGNDLVRVLRTSSEFVREDLRVRNEVRARWSWTITAARVAAGTPFAVLLMMSLRPEAAFVYRSPAGALTLLCGSAAVVLGYRLMLRAARLPEDRRLAR